MPKTKFQGIVFTAMMVIVMVYGMVVYNIALDVGELNNSVFLQAFAELPIMGIAAFILEFFVFEKLAKKLAFRLVNPEKDRPIAVIWAISAMTVCLMCPTMSLIATLLFKHAGVQVIAVWIQTTIMNFPMAMCWQIVVAGPLVRLIFRTLFKKQLAENK